MKNRTTSSPVASSAAVIAAAVAALAGVASAAPETVDMKFTGTGPGQAVKVTYGSSARDLFVGQLKHTISAGTGWAASLVGDQRTYCADLDQYVSGNTSAFTVQPVAVRASQIDGSRAAGITSALSAVYTAFGSSAALGTASNDLAAAFQIAVWEICYDYNAAVGPSSISLTSGVVRFAQTNGSPLAAGVVNQFNAIVATLGNESGGPGLYALMSPANQDQLIYVSGLVPTPGTAGLLGLGCLASFSRRRDRR